MSTAPNNNGRSNPFTNRLLNCITNTYIYSDSINEASTTPAPVGDNNEQSSTWVDSLTRLDRVFSGILLRLCYNLIDIVLLSLGLYYGTLKCLVSNALAIISIFILIFSGIGLAFTLLFVVRKWSLHHMTLSDEARSIRYHQGYGLCSFFHFLRFICICVGTVYVFTSKVPVNNDCEIHRFYLGIVCFNTWVLIFNWPPKPSLPIRQSLILECFILLLLIIFNSIYFGFVAFAMIKTQESECIYTRIEDLYFRAPLKSFAYVGLILIGCIIGSNILAAILSQLFYRLPNLRKVFVHLLAISYVIFYSLILVFIYYYSVGAVLLFRLRSGGSCRIVAPDLYKTLWIWQLIRVFLPIVIWPLAFLVRCLGVPFGAFLAQLLPASISVPFVGMLRVCLVLNIRNSTIILSVQQRLPNTPAATYPNTPAATYPNSPASPGTIDALRIVVFGQVSDEFNQTEWSVKIRIKDCSMIIFRFLFFIYIFLVLFVKQIMRSMKKAKDCHAVIYSMHDV